MTAPRDPDRLIHTFFEEGLDELPDPVYDAVRDRIEHTRQRAVIGPWRTSDMNRYLKIGLAAAAAVVIAVVAINLVPGGLQVGGEPSASPEPSATPEPSAAEQSAEPSTATGFLMVNDPDIGAITVYPGSGWSGQPGNALIGSTTEADTAIMLFTGDLWIYGDPCAWSTTTPDTAATTVDEIIAALASQASRDASAPADITVGGNTGQSITLHVPADIAVEPSAQDNATFPDCDEGTFGTLTTDVGGSPLRTPERYAQGAGQIDEFWVVDVGDSDGRREGMLFVLIYWPDTPQDVIDEMRAIVESATFELP